MPRHDKASDATHALIRNRMIAPPRRWPALRPETVSLSITPVLAGTSLAWAEGGGFHWQSALLMLTTMLLVQIIANPFDTDAFSGVLRSEAYAFLVFGLAATMGSHYVQGQALSLNSLFAACAIGLQASAALLVKNCRDLDRGRSATRFSLAHRLGRERTPGLYAALLLLPLLTALPLIIFRPLAGICLVVLSPSIRMIRFFGEAAGPGLDVVLKGTVRLQLVFGLALGIGLLFG